MMARNWSATFPDSFKPLDIIISGLLKNCSYFMLSAAIELNPEKLATPLRNCYVRVGLSLIELAGGC